MEPSHDSLIVVLDGEQFCFMYDATSVPELLEALLGADGTGGLRREHSCDVACGVIGQLYQDI